MSIVTFIARVAGMVWRFGVTKVNAVIAYARRNPNKVKKFIASNGVLGAVELILRILGY